MPDQINIFPNFNENNLSGDVSGYESAFFSNYITPVDPTVSSSSSFSISTYSQSSSSSAPTVSEKCEPIVKRNVNTNYNYYVSATDHVLARKNISEVNNILAYGNNGNGQINVPQDLVMPYIHVATGAAHSAALLYNGQIKCWGYNEYGQCYQIFIIILPATPLLSTSMAEFISFNENS